MMKIDLKDIIKIQHLEMEIFEEEDNDYVDYRIVKNKERAKGYREVGKNFIADRYDYEKYKWEKLLSDLDLLNERKIKDLLDYKKVYFDLKQQNERYKQVFNKIFNYIETNSCGDYKITFGKELLNILNEVNDEK